MFSSYCSSWNPCGLGRYQRQEAGQAGHGHGHQGAASSAGRLTPNPCRVVYSPRIRRSISNLSRGLVSCTCRCSCSRARRSPTRTRARCTARRSPTCSRARAPRLGSSRSSSPRPCPTPSRPSATRCASRYVGLSKLSQYHGRGEAATSGHLCGQAGGLSSCMPHSST